MKATDVKGLPVHPAGSVDTTGTVGDLILDLDERRVLALLVNPVQDSVQYVLEIGDVERVDTGSIIARRDGAIQPLTDTPHVSVYPTFNRLFNEDAMTDTGQNLGKVVDLTIQPGTWEIIEYDVVDSYVDAFEHGSKAIPANRVHAGARMVMVSDTGGSEGD